MEFGRNLKINVKKPKAMVIEKIRRKNAPSTLHIAAENIDLLLAFPYLGSLITNDAIESEEGSE